MLLGTHEKVTVSPGLKGASSGVVLGRSVVTELSTVEVMSGQPPGDCAFSRVQQLYNVSAGYNQMLLVFSMTPTI